MKIQPAACEGDAGPVPAGTKADIATIDVSFISQTYIIPGSKYIAGQRLICQPDKAAV